MRQHLSSRSPLPRVHPRTMAHSIVASRVQWEARVSIARGQEAWSTTSNCPPNRLLLTEGMRQTQRRTKFTRFPRSRKQSTGTKRTSSTKAVSTMTRSTRSVDGRRRRERRGSRKRLSSLNSSPTRNSYPSSRCSSSSSLLSSRASHKTSSVLSLRTTQALA